MSKQSIYLDYAAATPVDSAVVAVMQPYMSDVFYNPSASYLSAKKVATDLSVARELVAHWLGAKPTEVIFTAGGTEANNLAVSGVMSQFPEANLVISSIEHESIREPADQYDCRQAAVDSDGLIDLGSLEKLIDDKTVLVSVIYANNEIGTVQPLKEIATLLLKIKKQRAKDGNDLPIYFHTDACQAGNYLDLHVARLGVNLMTLNSGKIYGPKQSGVLYIKTGVSLKPQILGGGQERGLRSGTENVAGSVGFAKALDIAQKMRAEEVKRLSNLQKEFVNQLTTAVPGAIINGSLKKRLPNNVSVTFPGVDNERLMMQLDELGIMCAVGSACSASKDESSHVLKSIGLSDKDARSTLRFSLGRDTDASDLQYTLKGIIGQL